MTPETVTVSQKMEVNEELALQLLKANNEALSHHARVNDLLAALDAEKSRSQILSSENESLRHQVADRDRLQSTVDVMQAELMEIKEEKDNLRSECEGLHMTLKVFQEAKDRMYQELKHVSSQYETILIDLQIANNKVNEFMAENKDLKSCQAEIVNLQSMLGMLREINAKMDEDLLDKNKVLVNQTLVLGELKAEVATLTAINESNRQEMIRLRSDLCDTRTLLDQYRDLNDSIEAEMCRVPGSLNHSVISSFLKELFSYRDRYPVLEKENQRLKELLEDKMHNRERISTTPALHDSTHILYDNSLTQGDSLGSSFILPNEEFERALHEIERRNEDLKKKLTQALGMIDGEASGDMPSIPSLSLYNHR